MRTILAALAVLSLAAAAPASAHTTEAVVLLTGYPEDVSVTCDTSAYPAAWYPCDLDVKVTVGCNEVGTAPLFNDCTLGVRGALRATPTPNPTGKCTITSWEDVVVSFQSGIDPTFRAERNEVAVVAPMAGAYVLAGEINTGFTLVVESPYRVGDLNEITGVLATAIRFTDLQYDCRNRWGGNPSSDPDASGLRVGPTGTLVVRAP